MRLYLVRHGKADFGPDDAKRPLSERGLMDIQAMARHLADEEVRAARVCHSGLVRARQTAEILGAAVSPGTIVEEMAGIEPWGDVETFAAAAALWDQDTFICGHEPFMGQAVAMLLCGNRRTGVVEVKTGTVLALERTDYGPGIKPIWHLRWMLTPRIVRGPKEKIVQ